MFLSVLCCFLVLLGCFFSNLGILQIIGITAVTILNVSITVNTIFCYCCKDYFYELRPVKNSIVNSFNGVARCSVALRTRFGSALCVVGCFPIWYWIRDLKYDQVFICLDSYRVYYQIKSRFLATVLCMDRLFSRDGCERFI